MLQIKTNNKAALNSSNPKGRVYFRAARRFSATQISRGGLLIKHWFSASIRRGGW